MRWFFLLKFSTEIFIRRINGTLIHNGWVYKIVLMFYIPCYVYVFFLFYLLKNKL